MGDSKNPGEAKAFDGRLATAEGNDGIFRVNRRPAQDSDKRSVIGE